MRTIETGVKATRKRGYATSVLPTPEGHSTAEPRLDYYTVQPV
jgi:hypothetical protein